MKEPGIQSKLEKGQNKEKEIIDIKIEKSFGKLFMNDCL